MWLSDGLHKMIAVLVTNGRKAGEAFTSTNMEETGYFFGLLAVLLTIGLIRLLQPGYLKALVSSLLNLSYIQLMLREGRLRWNATNSVLDLVTILSLSFFIDQLISLSPALEWSFWMILAVVTTVLAGQLLLGLLLGYAFYTFRYIVPFIMNMVVFNRVLGLGLMPLNFLVIYFGFLPKTTLVSLTGGLAVCFLVFRALRALVQMQGLLQHGIVYNFCYLCVVELTPLVIVVDRLLGPL